MSKVGDKIILRDTETYIIAAVSRTRSKTKKIAIINTSTGMNTGRIVTVQDYHNITSAELGKAILRGK